MYSAPNNRIGYIDLAKGIAILSMVLCHIGCPSSYVNAWIYSFHMPIFFIISGFLLSNTTIFNINYVKRSFIKNLKTIIWPYLIFSIFYIFIFITQNAIKDISTSFLYFIHFLAIGYHALWFLTCIFISKLLFSFVHLFPRRVQLIVDGAVLIASTVVAIKIGDIERTLVTHLINIFNRALIGYIFIEIGYYLVRLFNRIDKQYLKVIIAILCLSLFSYTGLLNEPDLYFCKIGNPFLYYLNAILGSFGILLFCNWFDNIFNFELLKYYGKYSIIVLLTHIFFVSVLKTPIKDFLQLDYSNNLIEIGFYICYFVILCIIEIPIISIITKRCKWLYCFPDKLINDKDYNGANRF